MIEKLKTSFDEMVVYKNIKEKGKIFSSLGLPAFMRDWLLKKFQDENGEFDPQDIVNFADTYLPKKEDWKSIKDRIVNDREKVRILAKISVDTDIKTGMNSFALPDYGLTNKDTIVENNVWQDCKNDLINGREVWGIVEMGYRPPDGFDISFNNNKAKSANSGKIRLVGFKSFCPYEINVEYYKDSSKNFTVKEWIDVLLGAVDYNPKGYLGDEEKKLTMLTRLLPFVEKNLNLIELAPKGTGKSYLFGNVSKFGWLASGGVMTRAKMFYDVSRRTDGLVAANDFVTLDEVQTIKFPDENEMRGAMKSFCENGYCNIGNQRVDGDAGIILCGNIKKEIMDQDGFANMFVELPSFFHESALIERFHGFIKGWNIPRMNDDLKISGWALNSEYFCSILHELRNDMSYRAIVDELVEVPEAADTRDTEAVKRIATAYLKLLLPYVRYSSDVNKREFKKYCLDRARKMRDVIKYQLGLLDIEYRGKDVPIFSVKNDDGDK